MFKSNCLVDSLVCKVWANLLHSCADMYVDTKKEAGRRDKVRRQAASTARWENLAVSNGATVFSGTIHVLPPSANQRQFQHQFPKKPSPRNPPLLRQSALEKRRTQSHHSNATTAITLRPWAPKKPRKWERVVWGESWSTPSHPPLTGSPAFPFGPVQGVTRGVRHPGCVGGQFGLLCSLARAAGRGSSPWRTAGRCGSRN